jgi:D-alanyl-D-alanine carboxypeptidase
VEGIAAVTARIGEIRSLIGGIAPPTAARPAQGGSAFARSLAEATAATSPAGAREPATGTTYASVALGRPRGLSAAGPAGAAASLAAFGNGRIPAEALTPIGRGNHRLSAPAAAAFRELEAAAKRDGVTFGVTDSYRSYDQQVELAKRKGLYSEGGLAARPGTSDHGWGLSLDLDLDAKAQAWMRANAGRFGYVEDVPREPWHWTFKP